MHQIYSCSDENLEVFTTVISSKSCSPARRKDKSTQHILTKRVVTVSDYRPYRTEDLLPSQGDLTQVLYKDVVRNFGRLQNEQEGFCPAKHMGISEQESSKSCDNQSDGKSSVSRCFTKEVRIIIPTLQAQSGPNMELHPLTAATFDIPSHPYHSETGCSHRASYTGQCFCRRP
ncbi:vexin isoform X2 [Mauremys reevesii]|uniref:vexin isoform X2 n=1 Tax=Mauremys reevesii TaxID=260615 RepID=UPI00193FDFCE|nr:vexin isoform X2 [Mauremys reevesii]